MAAHSPLTTTLIPAIPPDQPPGAWAAWLRGMAEAINLLSSRVNNPPEDTGGGGGTGDIESVTAGTGLSGGGTSGAVTLALQTPVSVPHGGMGASSHTTDAILVGAGSAAIRSSAATVDTGGNVTAASYTTDGEYWLQDNVAANRWWALDSTSGVAQLLRFDGATYQGGSWQVDWATGAVTVTTALSAPTPPVGDDDTSVATTAWVRLQGYGTGGGTITLSGDLSGSGTTSINAQIVANAVGTTEIANGAITYAKVQNVSPAKLLGNPSAVGPAVPSEIILGTNLSFSSNVLNATGGGGLSGMTAGQIPIAATATTVTSSANLSGDVTSNATLVTTIANNAVTTAKIIDAAVTYAKIQNVAAVSLLGNPTGSGAAPSAITLGTGLSFAGSVLNSSGGIATPVSVANGGTGLASLTQYGTLVGNGTAAIVSQLPGANGTIFASNGSAANPSFRTLSALFDILAGTPAAGQIFYRHTAGFWQALSPGADGTFLRSGGTGANLTWGTPAGGGTVTSVAAGTGLTASPSPIVGAGSVALTVPVTAANGGTNQTTWAQGDLLYASAANTLSKLAKDATATRYLSNTGTTNNPAWAQVNVANGVTGTLPLGNGGTGSATAAAARTALGAVNIAGDTMTGNLSVGAGAGPTAGVLDVKGAATAGTIVSAVRGGPAGSDTTTYLVSYNDGTAGGGFVGGVARNGTSTVQFLTSSDARLKDAIDDAGIGLAELLQLKVRQYNFKSDTRQEHGLIAQEVVRVYPLAVHVGGDDPQQEPWMIDYGRLTPLLIKAVQELSAKVQDLEARVSR